MKKALEIFRRDIRRILVNPVAVVIMIGVAIIPSLDHFGTTPPSPSSASGAHDIFGPLVPYAFLVTAHCYLYR